MYYKCTHKEDSIVVDADSEEEARSESHTYFIGKLDTIHLNRNKIVLKEMWK